VNDGPSTPAPCRVSCHACAPELASLALPRLAEAVRNLALEARLAETVLCVDDLPGRDEGWLRLDPAADGRRVLTIYCSCDRLGRAPTGSVEEGARQDWEHGPAPRSETGGTAADFDRTAADAYFHHQCAMAADLLDGELVPELVPAGLAEAFAAAWDVLVDGRLARRGLPGHRMDVRRARFSVLFSSAGVLLPDHWQIFQSLWDGGLSRQEEVLHAVRRLPGL
jgi:hypothetical protein